VSTKEMFLQFHNKQLDYVSFGYSECITIRDFKQTRHRTKLKHIPHKPSVSSGAENCEKVMNL